MNVKKRNPLESAFQDFVKDFGGEVLPKASDGHTADYLFRKHDVVAELKTLTADQTDGTNRKLTPMVQEWIRKNGRTPPGTMQGHAV
jgi:hypothetical protein